MAKVVDLDIVFLTYDEPCREEFWLDLRSKAPHARRVQGVKGLDGGFKAAVAAGTTDHVITVDGDCIVDPAFFDLVIDDHLLGPDIRIDWLSRNAVNGVVSANGGIKCWPQTLARSMRSHECADPAERSIDFAFTYDLGKGEGPFRIENTIPMATVHCNATPLQAFRGAFREAVRLGVVGRDLRSAGAVAKSLRPIQHHRLLLWCAVGADVDNGLWSVHGARLATRMLHDDDWAYDVINDFDWFDDFWREDIAPRFAGEDVVCRHTGYAWDPRRLSDEIAMLGSSLRHDLGLEVADLTADQSRYFKQMYEPALNLNVLDRLGTMLQRGTGVRQSDDEAERCYLTAASVGHAGALNNLARLRLNAGAGDPHARAHAVALLQEASALGSPYAAHRLGRMRRAGDGVARDPAAALQLFALAAERGFTAANRDIAEMYETGDGVVRDLALAERYHQLIGEAGPGLDPPGRPGPTHDQRE